MERWKDGGVGVEDNTGGGEHLRSTMKGKENELLRRKVAALQYRTTAREQQKHQQTTQLLSFFQPTSLRRTSPLVSNAPTTVT